MRPRGTLLIVLAVLALAAAPADAAKLRTVTQGGVAGGGATGAGPTVTAVARCPKGTKAVSGGFTSSVPAIPSHWLVISESIMTPKRDGWRVSGSEHYATPAIDSFGAYAYCEKRRRSILSGGTVRTDFIPSVPGQTTGNTARCPRHTSAISGGFRTSSTEAYFNRSRGFGDDWSVEVTNVGGTTQDPYDVEAYCVRGKVQRAAATGIVPGGGPTPGIVTITETPVCSNGRFVRGGGYGASPPAAGLVSGPLVFRSAFVSPGWSVAAETINGSSQSYAAFGYCRPG